MKVVNHKLVPEGTERISFDPSPFTGGTINPTFLIIHYTATDSSSSPINYFKDPVGNTSRVAAHIVLGKDGKITQMVPFSVKCSHAGSSNWNGVDGMNSNAIGIEIVNLGTASSAKPGTIAKGHKNNPPGASSNQFWYTYPQAQLDALYVLSKAILAAYPAIKTVVGHDDVSPYRKQDPGPAFSWDDFNTAVFGAKNNIGKIFTVNTDGTNFRNVPTTVNNVEIKKLPKGYQVGLIAVEGDWSRVYLNNSKNDVIVPVSDPSKCYKNLGWIKTELLTLKPGQ